MIVNNIVNTKLSSRKPVGLISEKLNQLHMAIVATGVQWITD